MTEQELSKKLIEYYTRDGFDIYEEVASKGSNRRTDLVIVSGIIYHGIEVKKCLNEHVLEQAYINKPYYHYTSIFVPSYKKLSIVKRDFIKNKGIGVIVLSRSNRIETRILPELNRKPLQKKINFIKEHGSKINDYGNAGNNEGRYYTPFQETKNNIIYFLKINPDGVTIKEIMSNIDNHYNTEATAKSCLRKYLNDGIIPCRIERNGNDVRYFYKKESI